MDPSHLLPTLQGSWQVVRAELGGQPMPADAAEHVELRFTAERYHVSFGGEVTDEGRYHLTESSPHIRISMIGEQGVNVGKTIPGILQLAGDRLRVCYALESDAPPDSFTAPSGKLQYLATYRRKG